MTVSAYAMNAICARFVGSGVSLSGTVEPDFEEVVGLRVGLSLLTARHSGWNELRDAAKSVEDVGFDSLWVPDHIERIFGKRVISFHESVVMLGTIAECTERISIGASVHNAAWRHPVHLVHAAATLAEVSGGRFILGAESGGRHYEDGFVDAPLDHPYSRFAESVKIVRSLLDGNEVTYEGRFWKTFESRVTGVTDHPIPLMIAGSGPKSIDLAMRYGDEWNTVDLSGISDPTTLTDRINAANIATAAHGRSVTRSVDLMVLPVPMTGMEDLNAITGTTDEIVESLSLFSTAGFDEVHCYGPAPSVAGTAAWQPIIDASHVL